jgi:hypothetical protein
LAQLNRIGSAEDRELALINGRMSWLVISESFIFSAFTTAVANAARSQVLRSFVLLMPLVGLLLALLVYPAILAAGSTASRLRAERARCELKVPEELRVQLESSARAHFWGSLPTHAIPVMLILVWIVVVVVLVLLPWHGP